MLPTLLPVLKERGVLPMVDSDGDIHKLVPWLEEVGLEAVLGVLATMIVLIAMQYAQNLSSF